MVEETDSEIPVGFWNGRSKPKWIDEVKKEKGFSLLEREMVREIQKREQWRHSLKIPKGSV